MAKVRYGDATSGHRLEEFFTGEFTFTASDDGLSGAIVDSSGAVVELSGHDIAIDPVTKTFVAGDVARLIFNGASGSFLAIADGHFSASDLSDSGSIGIIPLLKEIFSGNDVINGTIYADNLDGYGGKDVLQGGVGMDILDGGKGNKDVLVGGGDSDFFELTKGCGHDIVNDFDAKGVKNTDHDYVDLHDAKYHVSENTDGDAVVSLNKHDDLTLVGISKHQLHDYDIL
jgi:Ca2+-binding RTX toxin-like protein